MYTTLDEAVDELTAGKTQEEINLWSTASRAQIATCGALQTHLILTQLFVSAGKLVDQCFNLLVAVAFEAGRLWGRSQILDELEKVK